MEFIRPIRALRSLILLMFWASVQLCWAQEFQHGEREYQEIKKVTWSLLEKAPLEKSAFVSVGRSGVAIQAYLSELREGAAGMLPLSKAHHLKDAMTQDLDDPSDRVREANERNQQFLDQHFEKFIGPIIAANSGRKIYFIDYVLRGSFNSALFLIRDFMSRKYPQVEFDFLALIETNRWERQKNWIPKSKAVFLDNFEIFKSRLLNSHYEAFAPSGEFTFEGNILKQKPADSGQGYEGFRSLLRTYMAQDPQVEPAARPAGKLQLLCPWVIGG